MKKKISSTSGALLVEMVVHFLMGIYREGQSCQTIRRAEFFTRSWANIRRFLSKCTSLGKKKALSLPDVTSTLVPYQEGDVLELDELWSFVGCKSNKCWVWIAICKRTRQVVSWVIGGRDEERCQALWDLIPQAYKKSTIYSDFYAAYNKVLSSEGAQFKCVGKDSGSTNHVERWNCTLRQRIGRFVRKSLSFSKYEFMHELMLKLFIHGYNLSLVK